MDLICLIIGCVILGTTYGAGAGWAAFFIIAAMPSNRARGTEK